MKYCKWCNKEYENGQKLGGHQTWCKLNPNIEHTRKKSSKSLKGRIVSDESRKKMSDGRKKWLSENPDKHPWRKSDKFISKPCEQLKDVLRKHDIKFEEEILVSTVKNYSVDIAIPSKNLIIEVNGNQHYNNDGTLKEYYQNRHDHIISLGWKIIELHYTLAFNHELCLSLINNEAIESKILDFRKYIPKPIERKYGNRNDYNKAIKILADNKNKPIIHNLINSNIDFQKFGWVSKASKIIGITPQKINKWMVRFIPEFYKTCYKRNLK